MTEINISGIDKARLLQGLFNRAGNQGMGYLNPNAMDRLGGRNNSGQMSLEQAQQIIKDAYSLSFDYVAGRVLKVNLQGDILNSRLYDRDNGPGAAAEVIQHLRNEM